MTENVLVFYETLSFIITASRLGIPTEKQNDLQNEYKNDISEIVKCCFRLNLLQEEKGFLKITEKARKIILLKEQRKQLQEIVKLFIQKYYPGIQHILRTGRHKASIFLPDYIKQILFEANLLEKSQNLFLTQEKPIKKKYKFDETKRKEIGTFGEKLSLKYEKRRVRQRPNWTAKDDDGAGYDIESKIGIYDPSPLFIEVKTTTKSVEEGNIFISRNEWETAKTKPNNYLFHIWVTKISLDKPFIFKPKHLKKHIPKERGFGKWGNVEIETIKLLKEYPEIK